MCPYIKEIIFISLYLYNSMISQLCHEVSADLTPLKIEATMKLPKIDFDCNTSKDDIANFFTLVNVLALNYLSIHSVKKLSIYI